LIGFLVFALVAVLGPLVVLAAPLAATRRRALARYSALMTAHNRAFEERWLDVGSGGADLLGSPDGSSLADLGAAFAAVQQMRTLPLSRNAIVAVIALAAAPMLPLVALEVPVKDIVTSLVGILH
jgi:hypothetical protein